jgi:phospholipase C
LHLDRIPRRYTVEAGKSLTDAWSTTADGGTYNLWVYGPNGFVRSFEGNATKWSASPFQPEVQPVYEAASSQLVLLVRNGGSVASIVTVTPNNKFQSFTAATIEIPAHRSATHILNLNASANWYDFTLASINFQRGFAGRMETGANGISDPAMAANIPFEEWRIHGKFADKHGELLMRDE